MTWCALKNNHNSLHKNDEIFTDDQSTDSSSSLKSNKQFENLLTSAINDDTSAEDNSNDENFYV